MAEVSLERQFAGQARLVRLLLWRVGDSTDIDECLRVAIESRMLTADDEAFLRECLAREERQRDAAKSAIEEPGAGGSFPLDAQLIARLRRCVDKLNRADAA